MSPASRLGASQLHAGAHSCVSVVPCLRDKSWWAISTSPGTSRPRLWACLSVDMLCFCCWGKLATCRAAWRTCCMVQWVHQLLLRYCLQFLWQSSGQLSCQTLMLKQWKQDMVSPAQHSPKSLSSFGPIPLQLKQFQLRDGLSSHRCLKGKMQCDSVKPLTYLSLGGVWTTGKKQLTTKGG